MDSFAALRFPSLPFSRRKAAAREIVGNQTLTPAPVSDESLLNQICAGDREALAALFERYARLTRSVALRILRDTAEAEDLVQDLFLFIERKCGIFNQIARKWSETRPRKAIIPRKLFLAVMV